PVEGTTAAGAIGDMVQGGADISDLLDNSSSGWTAIQSQLSTATSTKSSNDLLSVTRLSSNYTGYDYLVVQNLSNISLSDVSLSIDGGTPQALQVRGLSGVAQTLTSLN